MSTPPRDPRPKQPTPRAAEIVAAQVESIVAAAQESAQKVTSAAREEAESVRALARESAQADVSAARKEAAERIAEAQAAADDVLAEAKAVSSGMRQLAHLLTTHAERILRDVQNSHRAISADLRAAVRDEAPPRRDDPEEAPAERGRERQPRPARPPARRGASEIENPFDELEPPDWVE